MKIIGERKAAAARLAELTGERAVYTKMPRCAYEVGPFAIERDGTVTVPESADLALLRTLAQEGLLEGWEEPAEETVETIEEAATEAQEDNDAEGCMGTQDAAENTPAPDALTISMPLTGHTANSLRNLVTMIYSRGSLISKATDGNFGCTLAQVEALKDCLTVEDVITRLNPDLLGLTITPDAITFTGFPLSDDPEKIQAYTQLAAQMNRLAKEQKRTQAKTVDTTNEKYIFRIWRDYNLKNLVCIGESEDCRGNITRILVESDYAKEYRIKKAEQNKRWYEKKKASQPPKEKKPPMTKEERSRKNMAYQKEYYAAHPDKLAERREKNRIAEKAHRERKKAERLAALATQA